MGNSAKLLITPRVKGGKGAMHRLRREGFLPGSISKKGSEAFSFSVNKVEFRKAYAKYGMSGIYTLEADPKTVFTAMIREIQYAPGSDDFLHITLQAVSLLEETTAHISLHIIGREELQYNGYELIHQMESVHLKGLPGDFPASIDVDVSAMKPGEQLTVADLKLPNGVTSLTEGERLILSVVLPKLQEEAEEKTAEAPQEASAPDAPHQAGTEK